LKKPVVAELVRMPVQCPFNAVGRI
jgi:hypothetical protein